LKLSKLSDDKIGSYCVISDLNENYMITKILKDNPIGYFESEYNPFEKNVTLF
jgi:hypothetical protein